MSVFFQKTSFGPLGFYKPITKSVGSAFSVRGLRKDNFMSAIPADVTKEELAEIEQGIREEYNHKISDDQMVRTLLTGS